VIKSHLELVELDGDADYRLRALTRAGVYHHPLDAAAEQAGPAEPVVTLHEGDTLAELCGAQGGGVSAGPGTDHDYVVGICHLREEWYRR